MFVGEIGIPRREFLYEIKFWEARRIIRGYRRRERTICIMARQQAFWQVKCSMADTSKIREPSDLWPLPWDEEEKQDSPITEDEQQELLDLMEAENTRLAAERNQ